MCTQATLLIAFVGMVAARPGGPITYSGLPAYSAYSAAPAYAAYASPVGYASPAAYAYAPAIKALAAPAVVKGNYSIKVKIPMLCYTFNLELLILIGNNYCAKYCSCRPRAIRPKPTVPLQLQRC